MKKFAFMVSVSAMALAIPAQAAVIFVGSQAAFSALGTITQNTNFDSFGNFFSFPGPNYVVGAYTFVGNSNLIGEAGPGGVYNTGRNLFTDDQVSGTTVNIAGNFDLFAANAGNFFSTGTANFLVTTNLGSYAFSQTVNSAGNNGTFTFVGFKADSGENITSVNWSGNEATGLTDIQIGNAGVVPEPAAWALMLAGFGLVGAAARRRQSVRVTYA
jgi:hypothetical protein